MRLLDGLVVLLCDDVPSRCTRQTANKQKYFALALLPEGCVLAERSIINSAKTLLRE